MIVDIERIKAIIEVAQSMAIVVLGVSLAMHIVFGGHRKL